MRDFKPIWNILFMLKPGGILESYHQISIVAETQIEATQKFWENIESAKIEGVEISGMSATGQGVTEDGKIWQVN